MNISGLWEFVAMRSEFFVFLPFLLKKWFSLLHSFILPLQKSTEEKLLFRDPNQPLSEKLYCILIRFTYKDIQYMPSNTRQRWALRALTQNYQVSACITVWKFLSYLFFKFYILALFFHILEVNSMFGIWICGLRELQGHKCFALSRSRPL